METGDASALYLIRSSDLKASFGSYRIAGIPPVLIDGDAHHGRVSDFVESIRQHRHLDPCVLVAPGQSGPFLILDGTHRCLAYHFENDLDGRPLYLGLHPDLLKVYSWAQHLSD